jgi:hypothetical protein
MPPGHVRDYLYVISINIVYKLTESTFSYYNWYILNSELTLRGKNTLQPRLTRLKALEQLQAQVELVDCMQW